MKVAIYNRQRGVRFDLVLLRRFAAAAGREALAVARPGSALPALDTVEVTVWDDGAVARVNEEFLGHSGPTDVLTFQHGEILVSAETAAANAARFRSSVDRELSLYIVHGLLHLGGWKDTTPDDAARMRHLEKRILRRAAVPPARAPRRISRARGGRLALAAAVAAALLAPSGAPAQALSAAEREGLLREMAALRARSEQLVREAADAAAQKLRSAAASETAAVAFFEQAVRATRFAGESGESAQMREWREGEGRALKEPAVRAALRLHLQYLLLSLERASGTEPAQQLPELLAHVQAVRALEPRMGELGDAARRFTHSLLFDAVGNGTVAGWLQVGRRLPGEGWEPAAGKVDGICHKTILPVMREARDARLLAYWDSQIQYETERVLKEGAFARARFEEVRRPQLLWGRAEDMLVLGMHARAAGEMLAILRSAPTHPQFGEWWGKLEKLVAQPPAGP